VVRLVVAVVVAVRTNERYEMARAATHRRVATKPAAKPKDGTEKGAARPPAKKKTATGGARVALNVPHVAAHKPHEEGRAATVLDRCAAPTTPRPALRHKGPRQLFSSMRWSTATCVTGASKAK
jgi:hypothetical protein